MLADPVNGGYLQFGDLLPLLPVPNLILPGLFLLVLMGLFPLFLAYALIARPTWRGVDRLFRWSNYYWAWTGTLILVAIIAIWLAYEARLVGWSPYHNHYRNPRGVDAFVCDATECTKILRPAVMTAYSG